MIEFRWFVEANGKKTLQYRELYKAKITPYGFLLGLIMSPIWLSVPEHNNSDQGE